MSARSNEVKNLGDGADFKERVSVRFLGASDGGSAGRVNVDAGCVNRAGDDAHRLLCAYAVVDQCLQIAGGLRCQRAGQRARHHAPCYPERTSHDTLSSPIP